MKILNIVVILSVLFLVASCSDRKSGEESIDFRKFDNSLNILSQASSDDYFTNQFILTGSQHAFQNLYRDVNGNDVTVQVFVSDFTTIEVDALETGKITNMNDKEITYNIFDNVKSNEVTFKDTSEVEKMNKIKETDVVVEGYYDDHMIRIFGESDKNELLNLLIPITFNQNPDVKITD